MYYTKFNTAICKVVLVGDEEGISNLMIDNGTKAFEINSEWIYSEAFFEEAQQQIQAYFLGEAVNFNLKLNPKGTEFQKTVWSSLQSIPAGEIRTYKEVATAIGNPKASRAVGLANNRNPIPILIPCHRVVGANGKLVGYAYGLELKRELLLLEPSKSGLFNSNYS